MFVSKSMTRKVITVLPDTAASEARELMSAHKIRHLPVLDKEQTLVGIVSDRDIRTATPFGAAEGTDAWRQFNSLKVSDIMTRDLVTIPVDYTLQDALLLIQKTRVGAFPVVDDQMRLKGIISVRDLLRAFISVLGIGEPGALVGILVEEKIGQLKKVVDAITEEGVSFGSVLVARYWDENHRAVFPYLLTQNIGPIKKKLQRLGYTIIDPMQWYLDQVPKTE